VWNKREGEGGLKERWGLQTVITFFLGKRGGSLERGRAYLNRGLNRGFSLFSF